MDIMFIYNIMKRVLYFIFVLFFVVISLKFLSDYLPNRNIIEDAGAGFARKQAQMAQAKK